MHPYINNPHIKHFLDKLDIVLNSNSFLIKIRLNYHDVEKTKMQFADYIQSVDFLEELVIQDKVREWDNYKSYRSKDLSLETFVKPSFELKVREIRAEQKFFYLQNMLTIENKNDTFRSPYKKQLLPQEAQTIVSNFLNTVTEDLNWKLLKFNTDFGYSRTFGDVDDTKMHYFEGGACDSVTAIITKNNDAFILLTNGIA